MNLHFESSGQLLIDFTRMYENSMSTRQEKRKYAGLALLSATTVMGHRITSSLSVHSRLLVRYSKISGGIRFMFRNVTSIEEIDEIIAETFTYMKVPNKNDMAVDEEPECEADEEPECEADEEPECEADEGEENLEFFGYSNVAAEEYEVDQYFGVDPSIPPSHMECSSCMGCDYCIM